MSSNQDMQLSKNFWLSEFTRSSTAKREGLCTGEVLCIEPSLEQVARIREATDELWQKLRDRMGPMRVTGGLRTPELNELLPGSSPTSAHMTGDAADFHFLQARSGDVMEYLEEGHLEFDQAILYPQTGHIHLGYRHPTTRRQRGQLLIARAGKYALWTSR